MTLINPLMLLGLVAIFVPIAVHYYIKTKVKSLPISWAATRFLLNSVQNNRYRTLSRDLVLFLLKCFGITLLVIVFARPAEINPDKLSVVVVIDNSASMGQSDGIHTRFDLAKKQAHAFLRKLAPGSECSFYSVTDRVGPAIIERTKDLAVVDDAIDATTLSDGGSNLLPALQKAVEFLTTSDGQHKEIFCFTDSQIAAWRDTVAIQNLEKQYQNDIQFRIIPVAGRGEDNLAITGLNLGDFNPIVGHPISCSITVSSFSSRPALNIPIKLSIDDQPPTNQGIINKLDPNASATIHLNAEFNSPGFHAISASIPPDLLTFDDRRTVAIKVIDKIHVLLIEGDQSKTSARTPGFFIKHGLVPVSQEAVDTFYLDVETCKISALNTLPLDNTKILFLCSVPEASPTEVEKIKNFLKNGGDVVIFPGPGINTHFYSEDEAFSPLLPATLGNEVVTSTDGSAGLHWQRSKYEHPITQLWNLPGSGNLGDISATRYFPLTIKTAHFGADPPNVIIKYADDKPALVEGTVGVGKVLLFSSSATTDCGSLPLHPSFVPLLNRIVQYLINNSSVNINIAPGEPFVAPIAHELIDKKLFVIGPRGTKETGEVSISEGFNGTFLKVKDTEKAGLYRIFVENEMTPTFVFSVVQDPAESNLQQAPLSEIAPLLSPAPLNAESVKAAITSRRPQVIGTELTGSFAWMLLLIAIVELGLAHFLSSSR